MDTLYSIGYKGFSLSDFLSALKAHGITALADVRSSPYSRHSPEYDKEALAAFLKANGLSYHSYAPEFGGRQEDRSLYAEEGYLDYARLAASPQFKRGVNRVRDGLARGDVVAFMCAEKEPISCHRAILVTRAFAQMGFPVVHLLSNGQTQTQSELETELLDKFFPNRRQLSLFEEAKDDAELTNEAYRLQNAAIAYRIEDAQP